VNTNPKTGLTFVNDRHNLAVQCQQKTWGISSRERLLGAIRREDDDMELAEVTALAWSDIELESIGWEGGGRDVVLRLLIPQVPKSRRVLVCRWAERLVVRLAFPDGHGGSPLTWDAAFARLADERFSILLDFAGSGEIQLVCTDIEVTEATTEAPEATTDVS
jgi:hypothetical protein